MNLRIKIDFINSQETLHEGLFVWLFIECSCDKIHIPPIPNLQFYFSYDATILISLNIQFGWVG
jgi:hypothetical protein